MCGIIGIIGKEAGNIEKSKTDSMLASLCSRGPDDSGTMRFGNCILGQTRLSIIDLSGGHQPMKDNKRNATITFNGEIYNYKELKTELINRGHAFSTNSDTEVILKAYAEYGIDCPKYLDGMFVFAIWDDDEQSLFIARDRFGKKPFYYSLTSDGMLYFASEIKAIIKAGIKGVIDPGAIDNYLTLGYIPPWKCVYKNIHVLPPAHCGKLRPDGRTGRDGKFNITRYWKMEDKPIDISYAQAKSEIKKLFDNAVRKRMIADVEIGALLSGGVDSTIVCSYAQKYATHPLKTFSIGYGHHINELPFAEQASKKIGTDHYNMQANESIIAELEKVITYMDEPHADSSDYPQHLISQFARSKVKVALTGDGADELFLGYGWHWKYQNNRKIVRLKNMFFSNRFKEHIKLISVFTEKERASLWIDHSWVNKDIISTEVSDMKQNGLKKVNGFDLTTYLPGQLLTKVDRTSMMHGLEIRCPFLDYKLAEYVYNIPTEYKTDGKSGKIILKDILSEIMPREFVYRRKQGFGAPVAQWLQTEPVKKMLYERLGQGALIYDFLKKEQVDGLLTDFYQHSPDNGQHKPRYKQDPQFNRQYKIWTILCLEIWMQKHKQDFQSDKIPS